MHLNPVRTQSLGRDKRSTAAERAGIQPPPSPEQLNARLKQLREYPWSSYRAYGGGGRETERRSRLKARISVEQAVAAVEVCRGEPRREWLERHGDWGKWIVLRVVRDWSGSTLAKLGEEIGGRDYAAVGMGLRYFDQKVHSSKELRKIQSEVLQILDLKM